MCRHLHLDREVFSSRIEPGLRAGKRWGGGASSPRSLPLQQWAPLLFSHVPSSPSGLGGLSLLFLSPQPQPHPGPHLPGPAASTQGTCHAPRFGRESASLSPYDWSLQPGVVSDSSLHLHSLSGSLVTDDV